MANVDNNSNHSQSGDVNSNDNTQQRHEMDEGQSSLASVQMATGLLQIYEPSLTKVRSHLKELIGKQNKIYIDLSAEKFKFDNVEVAALQEMMNNVKVYREKLIKIKKQMQSIYEKTKILKKRAYNIHACKQKELTRKIQKQRQEEALIGKRNQNKTSTSTVTSTASSSTASTPTSTASSPTTSTNR